jgi:hypothetical protein
MPDITGATSATFTPTVAEEGKRLRVAVRATNSAGTSAWAYSNWTDPVAPENVWEPIDIPGAIAWYDASDASSVTLAGSEVTAWNDKSGNGLHLTQSTSARRPTKTTTLNSKGVISFAGDDVLINSSGTTAFANVGEVAIVIVFRGTYSVSGFKILGGLSAGPTSNSGRSVIAVNSSTRLELSGRRLDADSNLAHMITGTGELVDNTPKYLVSLFDYNNSNLWGRINGVESVKRLDFQTDGLTSNTGSKIMVGGSSALSSYFTGDIAEVIFFNAFPSTQDMTTLESYLASKWGFA